MKSLRAHIGVFGKVNVGKSSIINKLVGQNVSIVSSVAGTTSDPVYKTTEILGLGPVVFIDTPGIDDQTGLSSKRVDVAKRVIDRIDFAILVITRGSISKYEEELISKFNKNNTKFIIVNNKADKCEINKEQIINLEKKYFSKVYNFSYEQNPENLLKILKENVPKITEVGVFDGFLSKGEIVLMVMPIDSEAPEGSIILPQVKALRDVLDKNAISIVMQVQELDSFFNTDNNGTSNLKIKFVVTDSQAYSQVRSSVPNNIPVIGFSVLFSRIKGDFEHYLKGTYEIENLKDNDKIMILESCSHNHTEEDIGRYKIPRLLKTYTGKNLKFCFVSGVDKVPEDINKYKLVIQCGGCMLTRTQVLARIKPAIEHSIPISNYGMVISYTNGLFKELEDFFYIN